MIAVVVGVLLICYVMWREVKRTQVDVTGLKTFSNKVASMIESSMTQPVARVAVTPQASGTPEQKPENNEEKTEE